MSIKIPANVDKTSTLGKLYDAAVEANKATFVKAAEALSPTTGGRAIGGAVGAAVMATITVEAAKLTSDHAQAAAATFDRMKDLGFSNISAGWQAAGEGLVTTAFAIGTSLTAVSIPAALHAAGRRISEVAQHDAAVEKLLAAEAAKTGG